jgi:hypothetical protein
MEAVPQFVCKPAPVMFVYIDSSSAPQFQCCGALVRLTRDVSIESPTGEIRSGPMESSSPRLANR